VVSSGDEHGFIRAVYRSWFVLSPIAHARGREDLFPHERRRFPVWGEQGPSDSPFARVMVTAVQLRLAAAGLEPAFLPEVEWLLPSLDLGHGGPSWLAAIETIVESWLAAGDYEGVGRALDRMLPGLETRLSSAVHTFVDARLAVAQQRPDEGAEKARGALALLGENGPWWRAKAIHLLEAAGEADAGLVAVADELEAQLGIR
jgi:hypothetical protein